MRRNFTLIILLSIVSMISCKKDDLDIKPKIANIPYQLYFVKAIGDRTATEIFISSTLLLNSDFTWTLNLEGAKSYGTYSWKLTDHFFADIKFTISQWTTYNSDTALSNKVKNVLMTVNRTSLQIEAPVFDKDFDIYLSTYKK